MKNMYIILTLALFCLGCLYAVEADEYLIGAYSQWRVDYENSDPAGAFSTLREKLYEGGFNAVNYTILGEDYFSNDGLGAVLSSLHNGGNESVRTILTDFSYNIYWKRTCCVDIINSKQNKYQATTLISFIP